MSLQPLLVFDFDGVLVDGMREYWWSARRAAQFLAPECHLPEGAPEAFGALRPLIHKGWEMVLVALELSRSDLDVGHYVSAYEEHTQTALAHWGFSAEQLQSALEDLRSEAIQQDPSGWRALHSPYPGIPERLRTLESEGSPWLVLTTKGGNFARELLTGYGLHPQAVYGHEQGSKPEVLLRLREQGRPLWFVEDRRVTLETMRRTPGLEAVRCFLVSWGYLGPHDREQLPEGIQLLEPQRFAGPLASWP